MSRKPTIKQLEQEAMQLEKEAMKRKQVEESLLESEKKLRSLIETTSDWVWEVDLNGVYTYASPKVKNILGYDADEIVGFKLYEFLADEEIESNRQFFKGMCEAPEPFSGRNVTQHRKDGKRVITEINGTPVFDKDGRLSGYCGCDKNITEKVMAENALRESKERYRNLFENTQAGVFQAKMDGTEFYAVNIKFAEIFGYSIEEMLAKPTEFRLTNSKEMAEIYQKLRKKGDVENYEIETLKKNGEIITCIASVKLFPERQYVEGTIIDITERKKAERALREREAELDLKNESLEEMNAALRVLLKKREEDKAELEEKVSIPTHSGHPFRFKSATHSDSFRPLIPI